MLRQFLQFLIFVIPVVGMTEETVDFNRDIRPILTKNCTACHGGVKEAGKISFIYRERALGIGKSGNTRSFRGNPTTLKW